MADDPQEPGEQGKVGYGRPPKDTRFKKGVSGNPSGRPKGSYSVRQYLKLKMAKDPDETGFGKLARRAADLLWEGLEELEAKERLPYLKEMLDQLDGKPETKGTVKVDSMRQVVEIRKGEKGAKETPDAERDAREDG